MSLSCTVCKLASLSPQDRDAIASSLCWPNSDFHKKLVSGNLTELTGVIAVVRDGSGIVGWARSEVWLDSSGWDWPTLEAFVHPEYRRRGIASFATTGLVSTVFCDEGYGCAVFAPPLLVVAARCGLHPTLFERSGEEWLRADTTRRYTGATQEDKK